MKLIENGNKNCYELTLEDGRRARVAAKRVVMGASLLLIILSVAFLVTYAILYPVLLWQPLVMFILALVIGHISGLLTVDYRYVLCGKNLTVYKKSGAIHTKKLLIALNSIQRIKSADISAFYDKSIINMCLISSSIIIKNNINTTNSPNLIILITTNGHKVLIKSDDYMLSLLRGILI